MVSLKEIAQDVKQDILDSLAGELGTSTVTPLDEILEFHTSDLSLAGHPTHARGRLVDTLEALYPVIPSAGFISRPDR
jgi:hypothetical protein